MSSTALGIVLGLLVGLRHSVEPDHLTAVSTLVGETRGAGPGALLGALWGLGHTLALVAVGAILIAIGSTLPARAGAAFELAVAAMLLVLGTRAIVVAMRAAAAEPTRADEPAGASRPRDRRARAWRPLAIGLVHGLAGSGALTALVFAELPGTAARLIYMALFGLGSIAGMTVVSGAAGATLRLVARSPGARRGLGIATGALSIAVGVLWSIPVWSQLG